MSTIYAPHRAIPETRSSGKVISIRRLYSGSEAQNPLDKLKRLCLEIRCASTNEVTIIRKSDGASDKRLEELRFLAPGPAEAAHGHAVRTTTSSTLQNVQEF